MSRTTRRTAVKAPAKKPVSTAAPRRRINRSATRVVKEKDFYDNVGQVAGQGVALAGRTLAKVFGLGDYQVKKNVFLSGNLPEMSNQPRGGGTVIRFQEYLGDVITSSTPGAFKIDGYEIQPGLPSSFPWLSQIAANYEQYAFEGILYQFKSTSADALNSTNTALGSVMLATNYDVTDPLFQSKAEMLNYEFSSSCKPSESVIHMIECEPSQSVLTEMYTRTGNLSIGRDQKFYDLGRFQLATTGFQGAAVNIGEIHVTYQIRLLKPKLHSTLGEDIGFVEGTSYPANAVAATPLGSAPWVWDANSSFDLHISGGNTITLPLSNVVETFEVTIQWLGSTQAAWTGPPTITGTDCTIYNGTAGILPQVGISTNGCGYIFMIKTHALSTVPKITLGVANSIPVGDQHIWIRMVQIPNSVTKLY